MKAAERATTYLKVFAKWRRDSCQHKRKNNNCFWAGNPALLPPREVLRVGERVMSYLPRCRDASPDIKTLAGQVIEFLPRFH